MTRKAFLTLTGFIATAIGLFALTAPAVLLTHVKLAAPSASADVMARTTGILLVSVGLLNLLVRRHCDSPTMRAVLVNLISQLGIMPIDPIAYYQGVFHTLGSFLPNTILHIVLAAGFASYLTRSHGNRVNEVDISPA